jgi:hypothetical protein
MNMNKDILLYFALLLWFVVPVTAQPTIFTPTETVEPGSSISVDVSVVDFENILAMQFSINWNPEVLEFNSISSFEALPDYSSANFGTNAAHLGKLSTLWVDNLLSGVTLDDSSSLFTIYFTVVGADESSSLVAIASDPTPIEISDIDGNVLPVILDNGMITVVGPLSIDPSLTVQSNDLFTMYQNEPNPFDNQSVIRFDLRESTEVEFLLYNVNGKLVHSSKDYFLEGENSLTINADKLPGSGTYLYTLKTNDYSLTNKMVLLR